MGFSGNSVAGKVTKQFDRAFGTYTKGLKGAVGKYTAQAGRTFGSTPRDFFRKFAQIDPGTRIGGNLLVRPQVEKQQIQKQQQVSQDQAQRKTVAKAQSQRRSSAEQTRKANAKEPNIAALLSAAAAGGNAGLNSTLLGGSRNKLGPQ